MTAPCSSPSTEIDSDRRGNHTSKPAIHIRGLTKSFGAVEAVSRLTFSVRSGHVTGFLGPNGAGKTTTLRILLGLAHANEGSAVFGSRRYTELSAPQRFVGAVLEPSFHPARSARNHLRVAAATAGADDDRVDFLLGLVGLQSAARRQVGGFSLGMRQRLALAEALIGDPQYLILDEPANGLDPDGIRWLRGFLREFAEGGRVVLVSSHMLREMQATADDVVVIGGGRLLAQGSVSDLSVDDTMCRVRVSDPVSATRALREQGMDVRAFDDDRGPFLRVVAPDPAAVGQTLFIAGIPVLELEREERDLEARFFEILESRSS